MPVEPNTSYVVQRNRFIPESETFANKHPYCQRDACDGEEHFRACWSRAFHWCMDKLAAERILHRAFTRPLIFP